MWTSTHIHTYTLKFYCTQGLAVFILHSNINFYTLFNIYVDKNIIYILQHTMSNTSLFIIFNVTTSLQKQESVFINMYGRDAIHNKQWKYMAIWCEQGHGHR